MYSDSAGLKYENILFVLTSITVNVRVNTSCSRVWSRRTLVKYTRIHLEVLLLLKYAGASALSWQLLSQQVVGGSLEGAGTTHFHGFVCALSKIGQNLKFSHFDDIVR